MNDTPKFKLAFPLCNAIEFVFEISLFFTKTHFEERNVFVEHPVEVQSVWKKML